MIKFWEDIINSNEPAVHLENFHKVDVTWDDVVRFLYKEATTPSRFKPNPQEQESHPAEIVNNLKIQRGLYVIPQARDLQRHFTGVPELMNRVNGNEISNDCPYYDGDYNQFVCTCNSLWHIQGLRFSLGGNVINHHKDPCDVLYWQMLGSSYWTINEEKEYKLNPGDLFFVSKNATHGIRQDEPRVAILIDGIKPGYGKDEY